MTAAWRLPLRSSRSKHAFESRDQFREPDSEWFHDDTYLFAYDMELNVVPAFSEREARNPAASVEPPTHRGVLPTGLYSLSTTNAMG